LMVEEKVPTPGGSRYLGGSSGAIVAIE
jgi:hypothetical protein